jgi:hypothetical protein
LNRAPVGFIPGFDCTLGPIGVTFSPASASFGVGSTIAATIGVRAGQYAQIAMAAIRPTATALSPATALHLPTDDGFASPPIRWVTPAGDTHSACLHRGHLLAVPPQPGFATLGNELQKEQLAP